MKMQVIHARMCMLISCNIAFIAQTITCYKGVVCAFFRQKIHGGAFYESKREFD